MANAFVAAFEILSFGAIIVLIVLGLGIIASMMGIFNFAQGEFVLLGAYVTYLAYSGGLPIWVGMVAAPFVVGAAFIVASGLYTAHRERVRRSQLLQTVGETSPNP